MAQAGAAGVALGDGVGGDQPQRAAGPQQIEAAAEEVGNQIGIAVAFEVELLEPVEDGGGATFSDGVLAGEWRVTHK